MGQVMTVQQVGPLWLSAIWIQTILDSFDQTGGQILPRTEEKLTLQVEEQNSMTMKAQSLQLPKWSKGSAYSVATSRHACNW